MRLKSFQFDKFDVKDNGFKGKLDNSQMTQKQFDDMTQAWLHMGQGQGMALKGDAKDQETFKKMLRDGMTDSPVFRQMITGIGNDSDPKHKITADLGRSQPGVIGDAFATNQVDLDDLEKWPSRAGKDHPNQFTRNEAMVHFLSERQNALQSSDPSDFGPAHTYGLQQQNLYRKERSQSEVLSQSGVKNADGTVTATVAMADKSSEKWQINGNGDITGITPP